MANIIYVQCMAGPPFVNQKKKKKILKDKSIKHKKITKKG